MDTITQMAFGAVVGQVGWRARFGRRAMAAGALAALVPDLDVLWNTGDPYASWLYHRGISHSVIVAPLLGVMMGLAFWFYYHYRYQRSNASALAPLAEPEARAAWIWLGVLAVTTHIWLDVLTPYGTQILAPFSDTRFAINAMPIIDLTYTSILILALVAGFSLRVPARVAQSLAAVAIMLSVIWQVYAWDINLKAESLARSQVAAAAKVRAYPTLFTPFLRRIHAELPTEIHIGYWRPGNKIKWRVFEKQNHPLTEKLIATRAFKIFHWFAREQIFWRITPRADGGVRIEAHDLRYLGNLPDDPPDKALTSLWGIWQDFDAAGNAFGAPQRWTAPPDPQRIISVFFD